MGNVQGEYRQSNFELLRLLMIFFIVLHHLCIHAGFTFENGVTFSKAIVQLFEIGGKIGVDCFVLISGYFLVYNQRPIVEKAAKIWLEVLTYSFGFLILSIVLNRTDLISKENILFSLFPIMTRHYWFISTYIVMFIFSPWINVLINGIDRMRFKRLINVGGVLWILVPTVTNKNMEGNELALFILLYLIGAYVRVYGIALRISRLRIINGLLFIITYLSVIAIDILEVRFPMAIPYETYFYAPQRVNIVAISICLLLIFEKKEMPFNSYINSIASHVFGIYLFHENVFGRILLWKDAFKISSYQNEWFLSLYILVVAILVLIIAIAVDFIRVKFIESFYMKFVRHILTRGAI